MKIAIIGRTNWLLDSAHALWQSGCEIAAVITAAATKDSHVKESDFEKFAKLVGAPFLCVKSINSAKTLDWLRACGQIDLAVSINFTGVFQESAITLFRLGVLNVHGGDLPRYRGNACQAWAIINGEEHIGLCVHRMVAGELDSGDILAKDSLPININTRIGEVYNWMSRVIPSLVQTSVNLLASGDGSSGCPQSNIPSDALRCYPRTPEDGGINWAQNAVTIVRLINASSEPYQGAYCYLGDELVRVWRAELSESSSPFLAIPGQIMEVLGDGSILVACGESSCVRIAELEINARGIPSLFIKSIRTRFKSA